MGKVNLTFATLLGLLLFNPVKIHPATQPLGDWLGLQSTALAETGGRKVGGSLSRPTPPGSTPGRSTPHSDPSPSPARPNRPSPRRSAPSSGGSNRPSPPNHSPSPDPDATPSPDYRGGPATGELWEVKPPAIPTLESPNRPNYQPIAPLPQLPRPFSRGPGVMPVPVPQPSYPTPQYSDRPYEEAAGTGLKPAPVGPPTYRPRPTTPAVGQPKPAAPESPQSDYLESPASETLALPGQILLGLLIIGGAILALSLLRSKGVNIPVSDRANAQATVIKLQIGLLASGREIPSHLSHLSLHADFDTPEGLTEFLQESALLLLRHPDDWTHGQAISQTVGNRKKAVRLFKEFSIQERSKFKTETLIRVGGKIHSHSSPHPGPGDLTYDPAAYIVVTLLLGIEDEQLLIGPVHSGKELQSALQQVAALGPDELFGFELLWSSPEETDSLSENDLLNQYSELIKI